MEVINIKFSLLGFILFIFFMFVFVSGVIVELEDEKSNPKPVGTNNINSLVNQIKINNYFINNNSYWNVCLEHKENIRNKKDGYVIDKYKKYPIIDINSGREYKHNIIKKSDGAYEMEVNMVCRYTVTIQLSAFGYHKEKLEYSGGKVLFNMNIEEDRGYYRLLGMEAYSHIY